METFIQLFDHQFSRTLIIALGIFASNAMTLAIYMRTREKTDANNLQEKLFKIQEYSFKNVYLEDKRFALKWNDFKKEYQDNNVDYSNEEHQRYFSYEQYCEMLFNFASESLDTYGSEEKMQAKVDFKSWLRTHKDWWKNPLEDHSNHDTYDKKFVEIVDRWMN